MDKNVIAELVLDLSVVHLLSSVRQFGPTHEQQISEWIEAELGSELSATGVL